MSKRNTVIVLGICGTLALSSVFTSSKADTAGTNIGKEVPGFELPDSRGQKVSLASFKDRKAVVVIFVGTQCPINNAFMPRLGELHKEFASQGVQFLAINSNRQDSAEVIADHATKYAIPFPVLKDESNRVADQFDAKRTPEVFVLDAHRTIRYRGRIDDQFGIGYQRPKPTRRDLAEALQELLAGKPVSQSSTAVAGCLISRVKDAKGGGEITFTNHVARLLQNNCQECHRQGQIGPMPLLTYRDVTDWSETIREVIEERRMPPWHADPRFGKFSNDRHLSDEDRTTLLAWLANGMPKGDDKDMPPPREFVPGWIVGKPDQVVSMPEEFEVPAETPKYGIPYKHFTIDLGFKEDRWVERAEAKPGALEVVHHIVVFVLPPGEKFFPGNPRTPVLTGTAPGDMPLIMPKGSAKKIPAGSKLVMQMHYTPNGRAQKDRSYIGLIFAKEPPVHSVHTEPIAYPPDVKIPPGDDNFMVEAGFRFREDGHILSFMPHMHLRGKDFMFEAIYPDGKKTTLLSVPRYNFNWQSIYRLEKPLAVPKGTRIHCVAHFDNSTKNPNNPDPTQTVYWGDQTWEEMMIGWMDYAYDQPAQKSAAQN
jgi:peroxiredoxin